MKTKNVITAVLIALNTLFLCHATEVFLHNSYGASIYYKDSPTAQAKEIRNNVRISLGSVTALETADISIAGGSAVSLSYYSLRPTIAKIGFAANQHPDSDAVIYVDPSSFYQAWNIRIDWEKSSTTISTFKEAQNKTAKEELLKMLMFVKEPVYYKDVKNTLKNKSFSRIYDHPTLIAIDMVKEMQYNTVLLSEIYLIVDQQIPFKLNFKGEAQLKEQILTFIRQEMARLKQ